MRLTQDVFLEQQQKLMMTPELRQAIAILQMSTLELSEYIEQELQENPFLELKEPEEGLEVDKIEREERDNKIEDIVEYYNDRDIEYNFTDREESPSLENFLTKRPSLYEHLEFQLRLSCKEEYEQVIGNYLIGSIDRNGYLCVDLNEVASNLKVPLHKVEKVLNLIQSFHPHGVGARDLSECLLLQLRYYNKEDSIATCIIKHHMEDLARAKLNKIAQALSIPVNQVQEVCDLIRTLDPKPGLQYSSYDDVKYIMPDVFVEKVEGEYVVIVNDLNFPRLIVNNVYKRILHQNDNFSQDAKKYLVAIILAREMGGKFCSSSRDLRGSFISTLIIAEARLGAIPSNHATSAESLFFGFVNSDKAFSISIWSLIKLASSAKSCSCLRLSRIVAPNL
jgi:RNA polymerase sigma-54 factor